MMPDSELQEMFSKLPLAKDSCPCSYYPNRECTQFFSMTRWLNDPTFTEFFKPNALGLNGENINEEASEFPVKQYFGFLKRNGFCRYNSMFYLYQCANCMECTPVRIPVEKFLPSKNQRAAWNKNQDIEVRLEKNPENFATEEKAFLYREYDAWHNSSQKGFCKKTLEEALHCLREMNGGYEGVWNLEYRLDGRLIGVGILDYSENESGKIDALASNYFYYEVTSEILERSIGVFSVLKEIELCRNLEIPYYYLGLYLAGCHKMNYKSNYEPFELLINGVWLSSQMQLPEPGAAGEDFPDVCFVTKEIELPVLLSAYRQGIFPWFNEAAGEPVVWYSTDPRFVIPVEQLHIPKTLKKFLKHTPYTYTMDKCFETVMEECGKMNREGQDGTWIGPKMLAAYSELHKLGYAHSFEVWKDGKLAGGFYGILLGAVFCGESMFTIESSSSSSAFVLFANAFKECGGKLIDCQAYTANMERYGAIQMPRREYLGKLKRLQKQRLKKNLKEEFEKLNDKELLEK